MSVVFVEADVDPGSILLNYTIPGYVDAMSVPIGLIDRLQISQMKYAIVYGCGVGAALTMLLVIWIMCSKRTPLFVMNNITLVLYVVSASLNLAYITGPLLMVSVFLTGILTSDSAVNVVLTANAFQLLLVFLIQSTMLYQVYVMFKAPHIRYLRHTLVAFLTALQIATLGLYIHDNVRYASRVNGVYNGAETYRLGSAGSLVPFILFQCSVNLSSLFLFVKLVLAIRTRRYLGLRQFGVFHILMIVSLQTMFVPSVLVVANYAAYSALSLNLLSTVSLMLIVLSLPASSMWAAAANNSSAPSSVASSLFTFTTDTESIESKSGIASEKMRWTNHSGNNLPVTLVQPRLSHESLPLPKELEELIETTSVF